MTPRTVLIFVVLLAAVLFGEWFQFFRGFDTSQWPASNWVLFVFVILAEAAAIAVIAATVERSLPTGNQPPARDLKARRSSRSRGSRSR